MPVVNSVFVTIGCDALGCTRSATWAQTKEDEEAAFQLNPWLNTVRFISTLDKRNLSYCSDECEIKGSGTGVHNKLEPKKIVPGVNQAQVDLAARAAQQAATATAALKQGTGVTLE